MYMTTKYIITTFNSKHKPRYATSLNIKKRLPSHSKKLNETKEALYGRYAQQLTRPLNAKHGHVTERDVTHVNIHVYRFFQSLSIMVPTSALTKSIQDSIDVLGRRGRIESSKKSRKECSASIFQGSEVVFLDKRATDTFKIAIFMSMIYKMNT